ncbi:MAG: sialidase family protein [Candidatus Dormibacteria bacterium]
MAMAGPAQQAASPTSGTVDGSGPVTWTWNQVIGANPGGAGIEDTCPPGQCDDYDLTVRLPVDDAGAFYASHSATLTVAMTWTSTTPDDLDIFAYSPGGKKYGPGSPDQQSTGAGLEALTIADPSPGLWHLHAAAAVTAEPTTPSGRAVLAFGPPPPAFEAPLHLNQPGAPVFANYDGPVALYSHQVGGMIGTSNDPTATGEPKPESAEPSIGVDWATGKVMYQAVWDTLRVTFDDRTTPAGSAWENVSSPVTGTYTDDPILFTDHLTNRTFVSSLNNPGSCSFMAHTDDDGATWIPSKGCGTPAGSDHQTVGGGPFAAPLTGGTPAYADAVYYCSQAGVTAFCAISLDGGVTFEAGVPIYTSQNCGGLHGHIRVSPDGTAYVPNDSCNGHQGVVMSNNNGAAWTIETVPGSTPGITDPSVAAGSNNTLYLGYGDGDGLARVTVSHDHGATWSTPVDAGAPYHIRNAVFPEVIAGDDNRAAYAFLGTTTPGDSQAPAFGCVGAASDATPSDCPGAIWHLYVSYTDDGGATWQTTDATPDRPVQRGCIWNQGGSNICRNLLDFNDITIDKQGHVLIAYTQGCINACLTSTAYRDNSHSRIAAIARQTSGRGLLAAYDPPAPVTLGSGPGSTAAVQGVTASQLPNTAGTPPAPWILLLTAVPAMLALGLGIRRRTARRHR